MPTATLRGTVIAEATPDEVIHIEGNVYFPPSSVQTAYLTESPTPYTCPWKGVCQYWSVTDPASDEVLQDQAWSYPEPMPSAFDRVGRDFSGYVAFWRDVAVAE